MGKKFTSKKKHIQNIVIKQIRKISINSRLLISFMGISIVPIILILLVVNTTSINMMKDNIISNDKVSSNLITHSISDYMNRFDSITNEIIWDSNLLQYLKNHEKLTQNEKKELNKELEKMLRSRTTYISDIADFTLFDENFQTVYNEGFSYIEHNIKTQKIQNAIDDNKIVNWTFINKTNSNYIAITKPIKVGDATYGYIFLALKEKVILKMFNDYNLDFNGYGLIVDEKNQIVVTNNKEHEYISNNNAEIIKSIDKNNKIVKYNGKKAIVTSTPISYASWNLIGIIPYNYIYKSCVTIYRSYAIIGIVMLTFSIVISILIHKSIMKPINEIINTMNNINEDNLGQNMIVTGNDEISFIMKRYNTMSNKIKILLDTINKREKEKRQLTLRLLQAQINPHFLFNTLGGFRYVAMMNQDNVVANGLEALAKLLRSTILDKNDFISIENEIENVKNYITIQKIRYGDTFNVRYSIDEKIKDEKILKFILQPIVENCILHGFEESDKSNYIDIIIYDEDEFIGFEILDNGVGIEQHKLNEENFDIDKFAGIGVKNIKERINLYYEGMYTFEMTSIKQRGTSTKIIIPKIAGGVLNENINS